jgi:hypothetical protein
MELIVGRASTWAGIHRKKRQIGAILSSTDPPHFVDSVPWSDCIAEFPLVKVSVIKARSDAGDAETAVLAGAKKSCSAPTGRSSPSALLPATFHSWVSYQVAVTLWDQDDEQLLQRAQSQQSGSGWSEIFWGAIGG